jgi:hypothetical protein
LFLGEATKVASTTGEISEYGQGGVKRRLRVFGSTSEVGQRLLHHGKSAGASSA